jgi:hypothetical protein
MFFVHNQHKFEQKDIFFIITTSLPKNDDEQKKRKELEYKKSIQKTLQVLEGSKNIQVIIVENTNSVDSFMNSYNVPVLYTNTNIDPMFSKNEKSLKEFFDVFKAVKIFNVSENALVVKQNGRYEIQDDSPFIKALLAADASKNAIVRLGSFKSPTATDCVLTGLIALRCKILKKIKFPANGIEWCKAIFENLDLETIMCLPLLGIDCSVADLNMECFYV